MSHSPLCPAGLNPRDGNAANSPLQAHKHRGFVLRGCRGAEKGFQQKTNILSGNTLKPRGHPWPWAAWQAAGSALGRETGWLTGKTNGPGPWELQLALKGMLCTVSLFQPCSWMVAQKGSPCTGHRSWKSRLLSAGREQDWVLRAVPFSPTRQRNASVTPMSGSHQPKAKPGQESLSCLCAPCVTCPRESCSAGERSEPLVLAMGFARREQAEILLNTLWHCVLLCGEP